MSERAEQDVGGRTTSGRRPSSERRSGATCSELLKLRAGLDGEKFLAAGCRRAVGCGHRDAPDLGCVPAIAVSLLRLMSHTQVCQVDTPKPRRRAVSGQWVPSNGQAPARVLVGVGPARPPCRAAPAHACGRRSARRRRWRGRRGEPADQPPSPANASGTRDGRRIADHRRGPTAEDILADAARHRQGDRGSRQQHRRRPGRRSPPRAVSPRHQMPSTSSGHSVDAATANTSPTLRDNSRAEAASDSGIGTRPPTTAATRKSRTRPRSTSVANAPAMLTSSPDEVARNAAIAPAATSAAEQLAGRTADGRAGQQQHRSVGGAGDQQLRDRTASRTRPSSVGNR